MNFGNKIVILYLGFVSLIVTLVTLCYKQDVELVSSDYYAQEIQFQDKIDASTNARTSDYSIEHAVTNKEITLTADSVLLSADFKGTVTLFRPSDSKMDVTYPMNFSKQQQIIETKDLTRGVYKLQLSWVSNQKPYFKEEVIFIN
ncbi:MAG: FixH family protein [Bacteroidetes bacterium]|jgi:nitrogen fixation protein FixH|nr:FixH family protein [Bacteroidota bacterium]MDF2450588.1 FixH family protein [Bacteroidota bacterium]